MLNTGSKLEFGTVYYFNQEGQHCFNQIGELLEGRRLVVFGGPAPFSRLDNEQALEYSQHSKELLKFVDGIFGIYCQDAFVMREFSKFISNPDITFLADGDGFFVRSNHLSCDLTNQGLSLRSQRWAAVVNNGVIEQIRFDDYSEINYTHVSHVAEYLKHAG